MYRRFADELEEFTGVDPECDETGLLVLASSKEELSVLRGRCEWQRAAGFTANMLDRDEVTRHDAWITAPVEGALFFPHDLQVAPRKLVSSLQLACARQGIHVRGAAPVTSIVQQDGRVIGVNLGPEMIRANHVIVASGVWTGSIEGLSPAIPIGPRKGQILSLSLSPGSFHHMIRWSHSYFVPRRDGELVVGATNEDAGFDQTLTPAGVGRLLSEAQQISSHVGSAPIKEMWAGLRPATPDGLPVIGNSNIRGLLYATGHYRNGILLAPITAAIIAALIQRQSLPVPIEAFAPARFNV
jgi:glycine oxidase